MNIRRFLPLLALALSLAGARAATPTFSSFDSLDFRLTTNPPPQGVTIIHLRSTGGGAGTTNIFNTIITTNLTVISNITINTEIVTNLTVISNITAQTIYVTNLYVMTNLVLGDWGLVISDADPVSAPLWINTLWVNATTSQLWIWDQVSAWIAINPSLASGMYTVPTVADLRTVHDTGTLQWATTRGNLVATDGQGRRYWWDPGSAAADDGISVIDLDEHLLGENGRWLEE